MEGEKRPLDYTGEDWAALYQRDKKEFEKRRREAIEAAIASASEKQQPELRATQWKIDKALRGSKTPLGRMQIMQEIFYSTVYGRDGLLKQLNSGCEQFLAAWQSLGRPEEKNSRAKPALYVVKPENLKP